MERIVKSACGFCQTGCGIRVHRKGDRILKVTGDPQSPINRGRLCQKGQAALEYLQHPDRLKKPLLRAGPRGSGRWQEISWDAALDRVAEALEQTRRSAGPEGLVFIRGSFKGGYEGAYLARLANVLGAPNIASMAPLCYVPRVFGNQFTCGYNPVPDYDFPPAGILVWGANLAETRPGEHLDTIRALERGAALMVVDPRKTVLAERADVHLSLKPGSDLVLALALIQVIIEEGLYDKPFVEDWCVGFEALAAQVRPFSPSFAAPRTGVEAAALRKAARLYAASRPAVIQAGNAIDHSPHNVQIARALAILRALTGNLGVPGGELLGEPPPVLPMGSPALDLRDKLPDELRDRRLNARDGFLPQVFYALPQSITRAILERDPYPVRCAYVQGGNPLLTYPNAARTFAAFNQLDFLVVADLFMNPTAALADVVLPAASCFEYDAVIAPPYYPVVQVQQQVARVGDCRSDYAMIQGLARRLGLGEFFWDREQECLDFILQPAGLTFDEFRRIGVLTGRKDYRHYEKGGFATPSKKVELFSGRLEEWGFDPLPGYALVLETPSVSTDRNDEFPLVLTSWKVEAFRHSGNRQLESLRAVHPEPVVWLHPETAAPLGIRDGEPVWIETPGGRIQQKARITEDLRPGVAGVDYAWWFPERGVDRFYDWAAANINMLTDDRGERGKEMGTPRLRGLACRVYRDRPASSD
ncbi:MAG: molybdopterin-dependent oxidoreductase [Deltaproteobacteria bacterium]|nr:molybdopterin-dependent oxidoreductase [Deltaproteobacteria bacterium]